MSLLASAVPSSLVGSGIGGNQDIIDSKPSEEASLRICITLNGNERDAALSWSPIFLDKLVVVTTVERMLLIIVIVTHSCWKKRKSGI